MMNNNHQKPHCENNTYVIDKYYIRGNSVVINSAEKGRGIEKQGILKHRILALVITIASSVIKYFL